uniref:Uncharacterized protein n=1 Tax=Oryza sativa subsp. japonica TaxID=39947 RepID=Q6Z0I5_ORYSJ|nr:hypothetical protein [Oryza sativa Japonica Group]BAD03621.1 hypothetical protein [Oryza sativa Japonica Group]
MAGAAQRASEEYHNLKTRINSEVDLTLRMTNYALPLSVGAPDLIPLSLTSSLFSLPSHGKWQPHHRSYLPPCQLDRFHQPYNLVGLHMPNKCGVGKAKRMGHAISVRDDGGRSSGEGRLD